MLHITAKLTRQTPVDREPSALVTGVFDSAREARAFLGDGDPRADEEVVLPITWARGSRRPRAGETLSTTREDSGLVAVVGEAVR